MWPTTWNISNSQETVTRLTNVASGDPLDPVPSPSLYHRDHPTHMTTYDVDNTNAELTRSTRTGNGYGRRIQQQADGHKWRANPKRCNKQWPPSYGDSSEPPITKESNIYSATCPQWKGGLLQPMPHTRPTDGGTSMYGTNARNQRDSLSRLSYGAISVLMKYLERQLDMAADCKNQQRANRHGDQGEPPSANNTTNNNNNNKCG